MKDELIKLYNTMLLVETKGNNTIVMSDCLKFLKGIIDSLEKDANELKENEGV